MTKCGATNDSGVQCSREEHTDQGHSGWHPGGYTTYWKDEQLISEGTSDESTFWPVVTVDNARTYWTEPVTFDQAFGRIYDQALNILIEKQHSYGPRNVEELGFYGVFSRLSSDKIERIKNALNGKIENGKAIVDIDESLSDESIEDTLIDIMNYAAILIAVRRNQWGLPLE